MCVSAASAVEFTVGGKFGPCRVIVDLCADIGLLNFKNSAKKNHLFSLGAGYQYTF